MEGSHPVQGSLLEIKLCPPLWPGMCHLPVELSPRRPRHSSCSLGSDMSWLSLGIPGAPMPVQRVQAPCPREAQPGLGTGSGEGGCMGRCWSFGPTARRLEMCWGLRSGGGMWLGFLLPHPPAFPQQRPASKLTGLLSSAVQGSWLVWQGPLCSSTTSLHEPTHLPLEQDHQWEGLGPKAAPRPKACVSIPH